MIQTSKKPTAGTLAQARARLEAQRHETAAAREGLTARRLAEYAAQLRPCPICGATDCGWWDAKSETLKAGA